MPKTDPTHLRLLPDPVPADGEPQIREVLSPFEARVIAIFTDTAKALTLPGSYAAIYGLLYASPQPLSFVEIETRLGLSKGSVSQGLRALKELGAVRAVLSEEESKVEGRKSKEEGELTSDPRRRANGATQFEAVLELRQVVGALLRERVQPQLQAGGAGLDALPDLLARTRLAPEDRRTLEGRVEKIGKWRRKASGLLPLITKFLG